MSENEFSRLKLGQSVMYFGENDYMNGIMKGEICKVIDINRMGFVIKLGIGFRLFVHARVGKEYKGVPNRIELYRVEKDLPTCINDMTELKAVDYDLLIKHANGMKDFGWAKELHATKQSVGI